MREIKFRFWCGSLDPSEGVMIECSNDIAGLTEKELHRVMQFTGIRDRNDIDVYEGDIVECANGHIGAIEWMERDCCFNVTRYYSSSDDYPTMAFMEGQPFEVLGNIYENPELLESADAR